MAENIYTNEEFIKTEEFKEYSRAVQDILVKIMNIITEEEIQYLIKVGRGKNKTISLTLEGKQTSNIATVYIQTQHIRISIPNCRDIKIESLDDICYTNIRNTILQRYDELRRTRRQYSIYIYSDILEKIESTAKEKNKKVNELIEEYLQEKTQGTFLNRAHKNEFQKFLESANLIDNEGHNYDNKTISKIVFFYLISAYQDYFFSQYRIKFTYDGKEGLLTGPEDIIKNSELFTVDAESVFLFAKSIYKPENTGVDVADLWRSINGCDEEVNHLVNVAFKLLRNEYTVCRGEIMPYKPTIGPSITI